MSSDNANKDTKILTMSKFPHGQDTPRTVRWRDWQRKLLFCFGSHFPMLAGPTVEPLDPSGSHPRKASHQQPRADRSSKENERSTFS